MTQLATYRRVIIELAGQGADIRLMRAAAELAGALDAELRALFIEDAEWRALAGLPFTREFRLSERAWRPLESADLAREIAQSAARARQALHETATAFGIRCALDMCEGSPAGVIAENSAASDILVIREPASLLDRGLGSYARRLGAAYHSLAAVLLVPQTAAPATGPATGPVAALIGSAEDPALAAAAQLALRFNTGLIVIAPEGVDAAAAAAGHAITPARLSTRTLAGRDVAAIAHALRGTYCRLLVMTREAVIGDNDTALSRIAHAIATPVLAVEPR